MEGVKNNLLMGDSNRAMAVGFKTGEYTGVAVDSILGVVGAAKAVAGFAGVLRNADEVGDGVEYLSSVDDLIKPYNNVNDDLSSAINAIIYKRNKISTYSDEYSDFHVMLAKRGDEAKEWIDTAKSMRVRDYDFYKTNFEMNGGDWLDLSEIDMGKKKGLFYFDDDNVPTIDLYQGFHMETVFHEYYHWEQLKRYGVSTQAQAKEFLTPKRIQYLEDEVYALTTILRKIGAL